MSVEVDVPGRRSIVFLAAWKAGIELIGEYYFRVESATVAEADDKIQLRPNFEVIRLVLPTLSREQGQFLIGMCQFYSDREIAALCRQTDVDLPSLADLALLDEAYRAVLILLLESYTGWAGRAS